MIILTGIQNSPYGVARQIESAQIEMVYSARNWFVLWWCYRRELNRLMQLEELMCDISKSSEDLMQLFAIEFFIFQLNLLQSNGMFFNYRQLNGTCQSANRLNWQKKWGAFHQIPDFYTSQPPTPCSVVGSIVGSILKLRRQLPLFAIWCTGNVIKQTLV